jgi:uncharacterized membrane protein YedE/YeeE
LRPAVKRRETAPRRRNAQASRVAAQVARSGAELRAPVARAAASDVLMLRAMETWFQSTWLVASLGGAMIGAASALLLLAYGRIAGISGIAGGLVQRSIPDRAWRIAFVSGLGAAGVIAAVFAPGAIGAPVRSPLAILIAGLLVGFGSRLGNGCTSGHGVCGLSRWSARSLVAVVTFMTTGAITAMIAGRPS